MKFLKAFLPLSLILVSLAPIPALAARTLPKLLQAVEARYAKAGTLRAQYAQTTESKATLMKSVTRGTLEVKRPNKLRWEQNEPAKNLLVSDGKTFWFYTPPFDETEAGQLIERKTHEVQSRLATALLAGAFSSSLKDMTITPRTESIFLIRPRRKSAGTVASIEIEVDPKAQTIGRVRLQHRGGNLSEITLSQIELGKESPDSHFHFSAPPNTARVEE